jgi:hypothetical protein
MANYIAFIRCLHVLVVSQPLVTSSGEVAATLLEPVLKQLIF